MKPITPQKLVAMISLSAISLLSHALPTTAQTIPLAQRNLPDVLTMSSGMRVTTPAQWPVRRAEILELFRTHVYGRAPIGRPNTLSFRIEKTDPQAMGGIATLKQVAIEYASARGKGRINLVLFVPNRRTQPAPAFLLICNRPASNIDPTRQSKSEFWPAEQIIERGYAAAAFQVGDVAPDTKDAWQHGAHQLFDPPQRSADSWGTIAAWSWGASRILDYLATDKDIDATRVAVVGHSRGGKASLWAGAEDTRFALVVSNDSGSTGAALARGKGKGGKGKGGKGKGGERIADINKNFPHWFAQNYKNYNEREDALPVDQHQLIALIAPRPAYIASASEDAWADPASELLSGVAASPVYKLWNLEGLNATVLPEVGTAIHNGFIAYHLRPGKHNLTPFDWKHFMDFGDIRMKKPAQK